MLKKSGNRFYLTLIAALNNRGRLVYSIAESNFNMNVYIGFLQNLLRFIPQKVFLITDSHPAHVGKRVQQWLQNNAKWIEVFYLPNYAPELNPVEYFNQDIKTNAAGKRRAKSRNELKTAVAALANRRKRNPAQVEKYFHAPTVCYAAIRTNLGPY